MTTEKSLTTKQNLPSLRRLMQKRGKEEVGPLELDVWHGILLDEIAGRLEEWQEVGMAIGGLIQKMESQMDKAPAGKMRPFEKTITSDTPELWKVIEDVGRPCTCATIYNDGPDSVWVALNDQRDGFQEIKEGESLDFDYHGHPLIKRFFFYTTADGEANLRIPVEY
jgi:hypothetical protein